MAESIPLGVLTLLTAAELLLTAVQLRLTLRRAEPPHSAADAEPPKAEDMEVRETGRGSIDEGIESILTFRIGKETGDGTA